MPTLDCGIDIGSTNVKVVLVGEGGQLLYNKSIPSPRISDGTGPATDALQLVDILEDLIIEGWKALGGGQPIRSICAAGIGEDGIGVHSDLTPTGLAIPWFDRRAHEEVNLLKPHYQSQERTGIPLASDLTAAKWLWLHRNRPRETSVAAYWITLTDYPSVFWSGSPFMSSSLAPRTACYDIYNRQWIDSLLQACHAPQLPPLRAAGEIIGGVRFGRLRESGAAAADTLIVAGGHDHPVAATMIRRFDGSARVDSLGTANLLYGETQTISTPRLHKHLAFSLPASASAGISCLGVLELSVAIQALNLSRETVAEVLAAQRMAGSPPTSTAALNAQHSDSATTVRRALEKASLQSRDMLRAMDDLGVERGAIYATGGWSRSHGFMELRASIFGEPVHVIEDMELTAMGAALFGTEASTGTSVCPFGPQHITTVSPVPEWQKDYARLSMADQQV